MKLAHAFPITLALLVSLPAAAQRQQFRCQDASGRTYLSTKTCPQASVNKCLDDEGGVYYSDKPCAKSSQTVDVLDKENVVVDPNDKYATQRNIGAIKSEVRAIEYKARMEQNRNSYRRYETMDSSGQTRSGSTTSRKDERVNRSR